MFQKIKNNYKSYLTDLRDVRVVGQIVFGVMVLLVTWSGIKVVQANYGLQQRIARLEQEVAIKRLENDNEKLKNEYYNTDQYLELQARRQLGRSAPGESVLLIPKSVALGYTTELPEEKPKEIQLVTESKPVYQQNIEAWVEFIFRRNLDR